MRFTRCSTQPPAALERDHRQCDGAGEPADRDRQPVVRSRGDAGAAGWPAGAQLPVGVRSPRDRRRRSLAPVADLERRRDDRRACRTTSWRRWRSRKCGRRCRRRARRGCARAWRCARSARRSRWRPMRRRGRRRATAIDGFLLAGDWIDTGLPATIESAVISGHRASRHCGRRAAVARDGADDLGPRPLFGGRAQGQEPVVVRRPPGPQSSRRAGRPAHQGSADADRPHRDRARPGRGAAGSARSPVARVRHGQLFGGDRACRSTSRAWPTRSCRSCRRRRRRSSFRVLVRRADPKFPTPSPELARDLGSRVWNARGWKVDLDHADLVIRVEIIPGAAFCYMGREPGPAGCRSAPAAGWSACCPAASIRRWRRGA